MEEQNKSKQNIPDINLIATHESARSYNQEGVYIAKTVGGWGEDVHKREVAGDTVRPHLES